MKFNEDTVVEFLRSNGYNVNEAIDYILEYCGVDQPQRTLPSMKTKITTSSYTLPKSRVRYFVSERHTGFDDRKEGGACGSLSSGASEGVLQHLEGSASS